MTRKGLELQQRLSEKVIGCAMEVHRVLGHGFLERIYESALAIELGRASVRFERQKQIKVFYRDQLVGEYCCDFVVENKLILELKALRLAKSDHESQVLNYLKATNMTAGLLLNFGSARLGIRRLVLNHDDLDPI